MRLKMDQEGPEDPSFYELPTKAYHMVSGGEAALDLIFGEGVILPAAYRADIDQLRELCVDDFQSRKNRFIKQALFKMLDREIARMTPAEKTTPDKTYFRCADILAGDAWRVFLSPFDWHWAREKGPSGFVFDADDLIRRGASYRSMDFMTIWEDAIDWNLKASSLAKAEQVLYQSLKKANEIAGKKEAYGYAAIEWLEGSRLSLLGGVGNQDEDAGEIVWRGPLPVEWATEVWLNGEPIQLEGRLSR